MLLITEDALLICGHLGAISVAPSQRWVTVEGRALLVATDPEGRRVERCTNLATGKACTTTRGVSRGYSDLLRVDGHALCRSDLVGVTDGMPPAGATYSVARPAQSLVSEE